MTEGGLKMKKALVGVFTTMAIVLVAEAGGVKFAKTAVSVKETAQYAELSVSRTGSDRTRVRFATVSDTALPGHEYYATNGVLEWAANDKSAKKVQVRLMPDLVPTWESNKTFKVVLAALDADALDEGEAEAEILTPAAVVTLTEVSKQMPGTVTATAWIDSDGNDAPFANAAKPLATFEKNGGFDQTAIRLSRTGGTDGAIRVKVAAVNGTAKVGVDFALDENAYGTNAKTEDFVEWGDGDGEDKYFYVTSIEDDADLKDEKKFSVKLSAVKASGYATPKVGAATVSFVLKNALVYRTLSDYSKEMSARGLTVKGSDSDWYLMDEGTLVAVPFTGKSTKTLTLTLKGPGVLVTDSMPDYAHGPVEYTYDLGKEKGVDADAYIERLLPAGTTTMKFTLKGTDAAARRVSATFSYWGMGLKGSPFCWVPLADVSAAFPVDKAVVRLSDATRLEWSLPPEAEEVTEEVAQAIEIEPDEDEGEGVSDGDEDEPEVAQPELTGLRYRVVIDSVKANLSKTPAFEIITNTPAATLGAGMLEAGKTYYWRVDYIYGSADNLQTATGKDVWSFTVTDESVPVTYVASGVDANGDAIVPGAAIALHQGVQAAFVLAASNTESAVTFSVASGKLPDGLKLAQDKATKEWRVAGTPAKAGSYSVLIAGKAGKTACSTMAFSFDVKPIGLGAGTFQALVRPEGASVTNAAAALAQVSFTATAAGKLSAKVALAGKTYSFAETGYAAVEYGNDTAEDTEEDAVAALTARFVNVQKINKASYTNVLELSVAEAVTNNLYALGASAGVVRLAMCVPTADGKDAETDVDGSGLLYTGTLYRDNAKSPEVLALLAEMEGYYTVSLVPAPTRGGDPSGYGYATLAVDAKGKAKVAGLLADGTKVSASATVCGFTCNLADMAGDMELALVVPLFASSKSHCFGGELKVVRVKSSLYYGGDETPTADPDGTLVWNNTSGTAAYDAEADELGGFALALTPVGGWYDTVVNLQAYYKTRDVFVDAGADGADEGLPDGAEVVFAGDTPTVGKTSGVTLKFTRATGILTGTLDVTADGKATKGLKHYGVLLMNQPEDLFGRAQDVLTAGFFLWPTKAQNKTVNVSYPFCLLSEETDPDFAKGDEGDWEGDPVPENEE